jgi:hypothetical protein
MSQENQAGLEENSQDSSLEVNQEMHIESFNREVEEEAKKLGLIEAETKEETSSEERQFTELEIEQMEKGWDPNGKYDAETYKKVGELIEAKRKASKHADVASKEVQELKSLVKQLVEDQRAAKKAMQEEKLHALHQAKLEKINEGDINGVLAVEQELEAVKLKVKEIEAPKQDAAPAEEDPIVADWKEKNKSWLLEDSQDPAEQAVREAMRAVVGARANHYMQQNPDIDPNIALQDIDKRLRTAFPQKFEAPKAVSKVSISDSTPSKKGSTSMSKLDYDQRRQFESIKNVDPSYTIQEYMELLEKSGRLS